MGGNYSDLLPRPLGFDYLCIAIRPSDKLGVILGTSHEISIVRKTIEETWPQGIQREQFLLNGVHEFKMKGNPFQEYCTSAIDHAAASRFMAGSILHRLQLDGWKLLISSDLTRTADQVTTWIFKKMPNIAVSTRPLLIVGLSSTDSLMVLNAPEELHQTFKDVVEKSWNAGIQRWTYENSVLVIKLVGNPWNPDGQAAVPSRLLIQNLISDLRLKQWNLYGNSNLKSSTNTLFFEYDPNIIPGEPSTTHFTISLNKEDRLRLIGAPDSLVSVIRNVIQTIWSCGIQNERHYHQSWEFKLRGTPWWASGTEAVDSRYLIAKLLEALQSYGWSVIASIDSSKKFTDKSSLVFRQSQPIQSPVFCLSLNETDKLRLINAPEDIVKIFQDVIQTQWVLGTQRIQPYGNSLEVKLKGNPWNFGINDYDGIHARSLLCHLFKAFASRQWKPLTSADVAARYKDTEDYPIDVHSIFFIYDATVAQHSVPPLQATGYPAPPLQTTSYPTPQYGFAGQYDPPPPYEPPS